MFISLNTKRVINKATSKAAGITVFSLLWERTVKCAEMEKIPIAL
jgi:hypothetical protein